MTAQNSRNEMNKFNFDGIYEEYENNCWHDNGQLKISSNISNSIIIKEYESIRNELKEYGLEAGIISNGNHGLDLLDIYKERIDFSLDYKSWNKTPVMFVYDSPSDHLDTDKEKFIYACDEKKYTPEQLRAHQDEEMEIDTKYYLSTHLWREADINENIYEKIKTDGKVPSYAFFDQKSYGEFIVSLMINFELSNVYTTNLFRYQVTSNEKKYYNLGQMLDVVKNNKGKKYYVYQICTLL